MKTSLKFLSLFAAAAVPTTFAAELAGFNLPTVLETPSAFAAFVVTLVLLTVSGDYSRAGRTRASVPVATSEKAAHPLAA